MSLPRRFLIATLLTGIVAPGALAEGIADFEVKNRCEFPVTITLLRIDTTRSRRTLGTLRARERRTFRGALEAGRTEVIFAIALNLSNNLYRKTYYVNNPGPGKRATRVSIELTPALFGNPKIPKPPQPPAPKSSLPDFQDTWYSAGRGILKLTQSGITITGSLEGISGEHWGPGQRNGGKITKGVIDEATGEATLNVTWGDTTTSTLTLNLSADGEKFKGRWTWKAGSGDWDGVRGSRPR